MSPPLAAAHTDSYGLFAPPKIKMAQVKHGLQMTQGQASAHARATLFGDPGLSLCAVQKRRILRVREVPRLKQDRRHVGEFSIVRPAGRWTFAFNGINGFASRPSSRAKAADAFIVSHWVVDQDRRHVRGRLAEVHSGDHVCFVAARRQQRRFLVDATSEKCTRSRRPHLALLIDPQRLAGGVGASPYSSAAKANAARSARAGQHSRGDQADRCEREPDGPGRELRGQAARYRLLSRTAPARRDAGAARRMDLGDQQVASRRLVVLAHAIRIDDFPVTELDRIWQPPSGGRRITRPRIGVIKNGAGSGAGGEAAARVAEARAQLKRIVEKAPQVMVKVSGRQRGADHVAAHMEFIGRHGELEVETDAGESTVRLRSLNPIRHGTGTFG